MNVKDAPVLPWRKRFPRDYQSDVRRRLLGLECQAALDNLLDAAWLNGGVLPGNQEQLAMLSQAGPRWPELAAKVLEFFERDGDVYANPELLAEMAEGGRRVEFHRARAKAGAAARWRKDAPSNALSIPQSNAPRMPPFSRSAVQETANRVRQRIPSPSAGDSPRTPSRKSKGHVNGNGNGALKAVSEGWLSPYLTLWQEHGVVNAGRLAKAIRPVHDTHSQEDVERGLAAFLAAGNARFGPESFAAAAGDWINGNSGRKQIASAGTVAAVQRFGTSD